MQAVKGQEYVQKQQRFPAPLGGLNTSANLLNTPPTDALGLENFVTKEFGLEIRKGWRYWFDTAFDDGGAPATAYPVATIMPYIGQTPLQNRLFAGVADPSQNGPIYNITTPGATVPAVADVVPGLGPDFPGEWSYTMFTNDAGAFLCAVQAGSGYWTYRDGVGWANVPTGGAPGQISFPDATTAADLAFVMVWKERLWFIARNSGKAYYLPVKQVTGATQLYNFGPLFVSGGYLQLLLRWTYDGGSGMDDSLVSISDQGDMLIYQGTDPASASTFGLKGRWFVGRMPPGRRNYAQQGGDLWLVTEYGVLSVSDMVSGRVTAPTTSNSAAGNYNPSLAVAVTSSIDDRYWFLRPIPSEALLFCGSPFSSPLYGYRISYILSSASNGWSTTQNFEPYYGDIYEGKFIYGTRDGHVVQGFLGHRDGDSWDSSTLGSDPTARFTTGFNDMGTPNSNKQAGRLKLYGFAEGQVSYYAQVKSEYDIANLLFVSGMPGVSGSFWDDPTALWDSALWGGAYTSFHRWFGVSSFGKKLSVQVAIRGTGYVMVSDYEITYKEGIGL